MEEHIADELMKFAALRDSGVISSDEFDSQKTRLLGLTETKLAPSSREPSESSGSRSLAPSVVATGAVAKKPRSKAKIAAAVAFVFVVLVGVGASRNEAPSTARAPAAVSDAERWGIFKAWAVGELQTITVDFSATAERAGAGDIAGTMEAAGGMETTARRLLGYLATHPAASCYSGVQADLHDALVSFAAAGSAGSSGDFDIASSGMERAMTAMSRGTDGIQSAAAACAS